MEIRKRIDIFAQDINPRYWLSPFSAKSKSHIIAMGLFYHLMGWTMMSIAQSIASYFIPGYASPEIPISIATTMAAGPIEESIFFGLPYLIFSNPFVLFGVGFLWSFLHLFNTQTIDFASLSYGGFFFTLPHIFFSIRTWTSGKGWLAIAFHSGWNVTILSSVCLAGLTSCYVLNPGDDTIKDILLVVISVLISLLMYFAYQTKQKTSFPRIYYIIVLGLLVAAAIPLAILNMESIL